VPSAVAELARWLAARRRLLFPLGCGRMGNRTGIGVGEFYKVLPNSQLLRTDRQISTTKKARQNRRTRMCHLVGFWLLRSKSSPQKLNQRDLKCDKLSCQIKRSALAKVFHAGD
jgi:hypothetical protein